MSDKAIEVKNLSIKFKLSREKITSFKYYFIQKLRGKLKYDTFYALKDVSFSIEKGDVLGVIGYNGAGKSTLLKIIAGVIRTYKGSVQVNGNMAPLIELGAGFDSDLNGVENIYLNGLLLGYPKSLLREKMDEIIDFADLRKFINTPIKNYSSGMKARLGFSIATVVKPDILIVDEVLSVGDFKFKEKSEAKIIEMIKEGTTVLFVSHNITQVKKVCNKVLWLEQGSVKAFGPAEEICDQYQQVKD